jgi:hypothetical protein
MLQIFFLQVLDHTTHGCFILMCGLSSGFERPELQSVSVDVLGPEVLVLVEGDVEPRLHAPVEVYHRSVTDVFRPDVRVVPEPHHVPRRLCLAVELHQRNWKNGRPVPVRPFSFCHKNNAPHIRTPFN